jgi:hypothetical protein
MEAINIEDTIILVLAISILPRYHELLTVLNFELSCINRGE